MTGKKLSTLVQVSLLATLAGCGGPTTSSLKTGSSVNNGPGPVGDILRCESLEGSGVNFKFTIRHTAAITIKQGLLQDGDNFTSLVCTESNVVEKDTHMSDQPAALWECNEPREGDTLYHVAVHTQGLSALILADLSIDQVFPLPPQKLATLVCREPGA